MKKYILIIIVMLVAMITGCTVKGDVDMTKFNDLKTMRFSSFYTGTESQEEIYLKSVVPYTDTYEVITDSNTVYELYDEKGAEIAVIEAGSTHRVPLKKDQVVCGVIRCVGSEKVNVTVNAVENESVLPYDPINTVDAQALLDDRKTEGNPLTPAKLEYIKRPGGLYINCNNPEKLSDESLNKALTRTDVSNKEVFFTFEHNNAISGSFYYGYQVMNKGEEDIYITVKNIGFQLDGPGCWLGEREWIDFYNTEFKVFGFNNFTASQKNNLEAYFGFCNRWKSPNNQPITYRVPAGEHIYVMGGTTRDAYMNIDVFDTANKKVSGGCSNGAVLFEVIGEGAEGCFYAYKDYKKVQSNNTTHQGYVTHVNGHEVARQYVGYDNCHGVVDCNITWEFNDNTNAQMLPVTFTNRYLVDCPEPGTPYGSIPSTEHVKTLRSWYTHINPQNNYEAVGTDMTKYYTVDSNGNPICIDSDHYDGVGMKANIGNWMIDYMDNYTFVNHGSTDRVVKLKYTNTGSIAVMVRDQDGKIIEGTPQYTIICASSSYGAEIREYFEYTVTIPAESYLQFTVEYNLLANSTGNVGHFVTLE